MGKHPSRIKIIAQTSILAVVPAVGLASVGVAAFGAIRPTSSSQNRQQSTLPRKPRSPHPSLVLITIDTLRADHVGSLQGGSQTLTPALNNLARDGVNFLNTFTTTPLTLPAHASLMTGSWPMGHGVRDFTGFRLDERVETIAETLKAQGYRTAAFISAAVLDHRTGMAQGFDVYSDGFESFLGRDSRVAERAGADTLKLAQEWLAGAAQPVFLWLHLYEPHAPYAPPEPFLSHHQKDRYSGEVAYVDSLVSGFLEFLKSKKWYTPSLISVLSDHGEGLGEHGESKHGFFIYQSTMRVPWIIKLPGNEFAGNRVTHNVSLVDVFPTLLHGLGFQRRDWPKTLQGRSRYRLMRNDQGPDDPLYLESLTPQYQFGWSGLKSIVFGRFKFIEAPAPELYNLHEDPRETRNLFDSRRALGRKLMEILHRFQDQYTANRHTPVPTNPELAEQLRSLGYVGSPTSFHRVKPQQALADPKTMIGVYERMQQGVEAARQRRWAQAIEALSAAAAQAPDASAIVQSLALTYRDAGRARQAVRWFRKTLELVPEDIYTRLEFAKYLLTISRPDQARRQFERILEDNPRQFLALFNLGIYWARASEFNKAAQYMEKALRVKDDRRLHGMLADVYRRLGNLEKAAHHDRLAHRTPIH